MSLKLTDTLLKIREEAKGKKASVLPQVSDTSTAEKRNVSSHLQEFLSNTQVDSIRNIILRTHENTEKLLALNQKENNLVVEPGKAKIYVNIDRDMIGDKIDLDEIVKLVKAGELEVDVIVNTNQGNDEDIDEDDEY